MYLKEYNNNLLSYTIINNNINNKYNYINNIEKNIDNKHNLNTLEDIEFSIKTNNFNPKKNCKPNDWECRLIKRVSSFIDVKENLKL